MGTISTRKRADGKSAYTAQIRITRQGQPAHSEAKTFDRKPAAAAWLAKREKELAAPGAIERAKVVVHTLADAIDRYTAESEKEIGKTKTQVLRSIKKYSLAMMPCADIRSDHIVSWAREIEAQPQTVGNYVSHLSAIFAVARPAWDYPLDPAAIKDAHVVMRRLGITGKSCRRDRRPTLAELGQVLAHFQDRQAHRPTMNPMTKIIVFALFSTRRLDEILRIEWADLDEVNNRVLVRDMKNPGDKVGNHVLCDLPPEAMRVIKSMPRSMPQIFPFGPDAVGALFTRVCKFLEIINLHFHDLRHEGISRLFEIGWTIPQVATVSGHRSWQSLQRYAHLRQAGDKYDGWPWLDAVTADPHAGKANVITMRR